MPPLLWDAIPLGAVLVATAYVAWTRRPRRPVEVDETVRSHAQFRAALRQATVRSAEESSVGAVDGSR